MLKGKRILVLGDPSFFEEGIGRYLAKNNDVRYEEPGTIFSLARHLASADLVWVEWAGKWCSLVGRLRPPCRTVCRIHRVEIFRPRRIDLHHWDAYDHVFLVSGRMRQCFIERIENHPQPKTTSVLYNGIDLFQYSFKDRKPGFNIAAIAHVNFRKNLEMMIWIMNQLVQIDRRYRLTVVGGVFEEDCLDAFLFNIKRAGLSENIHYEGMLKHDQIPQWLADKNFILSTSLHEGHPVALNEAMACGIKPVIYEYPGSLEVFPKDLLFDTVSGAVDLITSGQYDSRRYREWVAARFALENQCDKIESELGRILELPGHNSRWDFVITTLKSAWYRRSFRIPQLSSD